MRSLIVFPVILASLTVAAHAQTPASSAALRFFGTGSAPPGQQDRIRIPIDDDAPGPDASAPCDVGGGSFTIDFWVRGTLADNATSNAGGNAECYCFNWIDGNIIIDRDIFGGSERDWGISIAGGFVRFGVGMGDAGGASENTIEGGAAILDSTWRHVACVRDASLGQLRIYIDASLDFAGSLGVNAADISYPDSGAPGQFTPWGPYIVIAAEKHDAGPAYPSFTGLIDEVRIWSRALTPTEIVRVHNRALVRGSPHALGLVAAYRFEEGAGTAVFDTSNGGSPAGLLIAGIPGNGEWVLRAVNPASVAPVTFCPGDADGDLSVNFADITAVLANFGTTSPGGLAPGDANADLAVNFADATVVLANFGSGCP